MLEDTGNEKEELLKGIEILKQTQQWFQHRVDQLKLEGSNTKKVVNRNPPKIAYVLMH